MEFLSNTHVQYYLAAFFAGGIPFGLILARVFAGIDIRKEGSGGIGATNVLRVLTQKQKPTLAKQIAAATLFFDSIKGAVILGVAMLSGMPDSTLWAIAFLAVLGHCYSPYLMFEGGKGVATAFGVMVLLLPVESAIGLGVWFISAKVLKVSSMASLLGLLAVVISSFLLHPEIPEIHSHAPIVLIAIVIVYKHIPNIIRMVQNREQPVL